MRKFICTGILLALSLSACGGPGVQDWRQPLFGDREKPAPLKQLQNAFLIQRLMTSKMPRRTTVQITATSQSREL